MTKLPKDIEKRLYDKSATREDFVDIIEMALSKQRKEIIEKLTSGQVGITKDTRGKEREYLFLDDAIKTIKNEKK